jgi:hypothetical protein
MTPQDVQSYAVSFTAIAGGICSLWATFHNGRGIRTIEKNTDGLLAASVLRADAATAKDTAQQVQIATLEAQGRPPLAP